MNTLTAQQYTADEVQVYLRDQARRLTAEHPTGTICVIVNLKGAFTLGADFCRYINDCDPTNARCQFAVVSVKSYGNGQTAGQARVDIPLSADDRTLAGAAKVVVLIEDIFETGTAASFLINHYLPTMLGKQAVLFFPVFDKVATVKTAGCPPTWNQPLPVQGWIEGEGMGTGEEGRFKRGIAAVD